MSFFLSSENIFDYLIAQGITTSAEIDSSKVELKPAKNFNLLITFPYGNQVLVKQERYNHAGETIGEFLHEWRIHQFYQTFSEASHLRKYLSEAIHFDPENSILIFNYLQGYRDLGDFYASENVFPTEIARSLGVTLAEIHRLTINQSQYAEFFPLIGGENSRIPYLAKGLDRLTPEIFSMFPADGLKFFTLYQRYDNLSRSIASLNQAFIPCCLTHNDLKLNNILLSLNWETEIISTSPHSQQIVRIIDWERGRWGDPANDLGSIIASYLQIWIHSMVTGKTIPIEESLRLAAIPLQMLQPSIATLVATYLAEFPEILKFRPNFLELVVQFAGLALIRSIQATLQHEKTFDNTGICILQVAKSLLCRPQVSISTIFGMEATQLISNSFSLV
jgi:thiamine kinase-like enzyme